ncbi:MAG TPA: ABC transporter permease, partial [Terriglobales bacterium]|nr:ABC transporter permease [Terriglobales bacterium]
PLPYSNPDRIVALQNYWLKTQTIGRQVSMPDFIDWRNQAQSFAALGYYQNWPHSIFANNLALEVNAAIADSQFFKVLGVQPRLGGMYQGHDAHQTDTRVMLIGEALWRRVFHADPHVIGTPVKMDQREYTIIGVMPRGFDFPEQSELWIPDYNDYPAYAHARSGNNYRAIGLLKAGVPLEQARVEMKTIGARLAQQYPAEDAEKSVSVTPLHDELVRKVRMTLYLLLGAVALILLIACANIANLMLAKVTARRREIAIRTALGASRGQIVGQLLAESLVLAFSAGAIGLLVGWWSAQGLGRIAPAQLIANTPITFDWRVGLFAACVSLICTVIFGLAPAFRASNTDVRGGLHAAGSYTIAGGGMGKLRGAIVVSEIAMSVALLIGAAVLIRSLIALNSVDPGYRVEGLTVMRSSYPAENVDDAKNAVRFYASLLSGASSIPGIQDVAATNAPPTENTSDGQFLIEGRPDPAAGDFFTQSAGFMLVSPSYFHALGIPFVGGRDFNQHDNVDGQLTCIINTELAEKSFPGQNPIGHRIKTGYDTVNGFMTIVGVVASVRQDSVEKPPSPYIYMPYQQHPLPATHMEVLFRDKGGAASALRGEAHRLDPEVAVDFEPLEQVVAQGFAPSRFRSGM